MAYREELVTLIANGTAPVDIFSHFSQHHHLHRSRIISLLKQSGVTIRIPQSGDEISDERRRELQELSTSD